MSASSKTIHPDEKVKGTAFGATMTKVGFGVGIVLLAIAAILAFTTKDTDHYRRFQFGYLIAWLFVYTLAMGSLFFVLIHHLTRARWSTVMRRVAENVSMTFPLLAVLGLGFLLPMLAGNHNLYYWSYFGNEVAHNPELKELNHHLAGKLGWLSPGFFTLRFFLYMAIYSGMAWYFSKWSRAQDESGDAKISEKLRVASGPGMLVFSLTTVFVGFDVAMSISPEWYSTIYSVIIFGGGMVGTYAFLSILTRVIQKNGLVTRSITVEHYHDMGKFLFGFTFFWAYVSFSQFVLIWYANIPEEVVFYRYRMQGDWMYVSIIVLLCAWAIPYVALLSRWTKRILPIFMALCTWQLVFHYVDLYWNIMPNIEWGHEAHGLLHGPLTGPVADHHYSFNITDVLLWLGMTFVFIGGIGRNLKGNLLPVKDPTLGASLAFENY